MIPKLRKLSLLYLLLMILGLPIVSSVTSQAAPAAYDCAAQTDIPTAECEALVAIYYANPDAAEFYQNLNWLEIGSLPCTWYNVTCSDSEEKHVEGLSLNHITVLPAEIGQLTQLKGLGLYSNSTISYITLPPEMGNLSQLQSISMGGRTAFVIPSEMSKLENLKRFTYAFGLTNNVMPTGIGYLIHLETLNVSRSHLKMFPQRLGTW